MQVLQGAVDVALEALRQIEAFEAAVQQQAVAAARGDHGGAMSAAQACARLRKLIDQVHLVYQRWWAACMQSATRCCQLLVPTLLHAHSTTCGAWQPLLAKKVWRAAGLLERHACYSALTVFNQKPKTAFLVIPQLDTLVPYLTVAISSASLAGSGSAGGGVYDRLSPTRLLAASSVLLAAAGRPATCVFEIRRVRKG